MNEKLNLNIEKAREALNQADALVILAGAGMGVDSGLPDFRGKRGFWRAYPMLKRKRLSFYDMASPDMFRANPSLAWGFYGQRLSLYRQTNPHSGFFKLKDIAEKMTNGYFVFTSNVDGHFQKSGYSEDIIYECHGSINYLQTLEGDQTYSADNVEVKVSSYSLMALDLPRNENGDLLRPNVMMFDDWTFNDKRYLEQEKRYHDWLDSLPDNSNIVLVEVGAGKAIPTVRMESQRLKKCKNATYIQINPDSERFANISVTLGAEEALTKILSPTIT